MKYSNYLVEITGITIYPLISLAIFVTFFCAVLIKVFYMDKEKIKHISNLPLDNKNK